MRIYLIAAGVFALGSFASLILAGISARSDRRWRRLIETQSKEPYGV